jgi:hypothetical protein
LNCSGESWERSMKTEDTEASAQYATAEKVAY